MSLWLYVGFVSQSLTGFATDLPLRNKQKTTWMRLTKSWKKPQLRISLKIVMKKCSGMIRFLAMTL